MTYDIIIIGSGIAGLYAAYNIRQMDASLSILILEKNKKHDIGGRANTELFYGTNIQIGAGIGRKRDRLLKKLMVDFDFEINEFKVEPHFSPLIDPVDVNEIMAELRVAYRKYKGPPTTFERFAKPILGENIYKRFLLSSGYTDYEKENAEDTLYNYGMEDNACCLTGFGVNWHELVAAMADDIGSIHFRFSQNVSRISESKHIGELSSSHRYLVETDSNTWFRCNHIIAATTITSLRSLFPRHPVYKEIEGQPFLRIYGKFAKQSIPILKEYIPGGHISVPGPIQKIIAMNPDEGVYMIVYNDNKHTLALKSRTENTEPNREFYCNLIERSLAIPASKRIHLIAIRSFYWNVGTHYYKPLNVEKWKDRDDFINAAQNPADGILVVGEVVSKHQGWVEGALESVKSVVTKRWVADVCRNK
jgi:hypothetical protein